MKKIKTLGLGLCIIGLIAMTLILFQNYMYHYSDGLFMIKEKTIIFSLYLTGFTLMIFGDKK